MRSIDKLPQYLKKFCSSQDMSKYTARDHASWRYIMNRSLPFFRKHAVHVYEDGLIKTGLPRESIPNIDAMDEALQKIGWGAVPITGFIPTFAFIEFQANKILPIATDMRTMNHIGYTPAPDIVHEAAGHAPILPDSGYADYLADYGKTAVNAIYSKEDLMIYEAVRALSDIKEKPDAHPDEISALEKALKETTARCTYVSEQARAARMSWWTNEYGLVGDLANPKIYGAGLLSSVTESKNVYQDHVKKIRLSTACLDTSYDITRPQPQLYVAEDMQHLIDVGRDFDAGLSYRIGGKLAITRAQEARAITTTVLSSGLEISGVVETFETGIEDRIDFIKWSGPVQLCHQRRELPEQGKERHPQGFSGPIGLWESIDQDPSTLKDPEMEKIGLKTGQYVNLEFKNGFKVEGNLQKVVRGHHKESGSERILYMTFIDCKVTKGGQVYYQPDWGPFDMPVGKNIPSVFGGPSDRSAFGEEELAEVTSTPSRSTPYSTNELNAFDIYKKIRDLRSKNGTATDYDLLGDTLLNDHPEEWLALLEIQEKSPNPKILAHLTDKNLYPVPIQNLINEGLELLS